MRKKTKKKSTQNKKKGNDKSTEIESVANTSISVNKSKRVNSTDKTSSITEKSPASSPWIDALTRSENRGNDFNLGNHPHIGMQLSFIEPRIVNENSIHRLDSNNIDTDVAF